MSDRIPFIDPNVRFIGVSWLRELNSDKLAALKKTYVIQDDEGPLAVMMPYATFLKMQEVLNDGEDTYTLTEIGKRVADIEMGISMATEVPD